MRKRDFVTTGIPSIFTIFTVLVLVILALMSYGTSRTDLEESRLSLEQTENYYEACEAGTRIYSEACTALQGLSGDALAKAAEKYFSSLPSAEGQSCRYDPETGDATLLLTYSKRQALEFQFQVSEDAASPLACSWRSVQSGEWKASALDNLYDPSKGLPLAAPSP